MSKWIKVTERLPPESHIDVLLYIKNRNQIQSGRIFQSSYNGTNTIYTQNSSGYNLWDEVTHWRPMVKAPPLDEM